MPGGQRPLGQANVGVTEDWGQTFGRIKYDWKRKSGQGTIKILWMTSLRISLTSLLVLGGAELNFGVLKHPEREYKLHPRRSDKFLGYPVILVSCLR